MMLKKRKKVKKVKIKNNVYWRKFKKFKSYNSWSAEPVGNYLAYLKSKNLIFISGQLPIDTNGKVIEGKIGLDLNNEDGEKATKLAILNVLGQLKKATGDLNLIKEMY